jgi:hypothetical protein
MLQVAAALLNPPRPVSCTAVRTAFVTNTMCQ